MTKDHRVIGGAIICVVCLLGFLISACIALSYAPNPIESVISNTVSTCYNTANGDICTHGVR